MKNIIIPILCALFPLSAIAQRTVKADVKNVAKDEIKTEVVTPLGTFSRIDNVKPSQEDFIYSSGSFTTHDGGTAEFLIAREEEPEVQHSISSKVSGSAISPNPFHSSANVFIKPVKDFHSGWFIVYDLIGREISRTALQNPQTEFSRGSLSDGMYFYKITGEEEMLVDMGKFVVN